MEHVHALPAGTRLGEYEVVDVLGAGGFGITYQAWDTKLHKYVAVKEYLPRDFATRTNTGTVVPTSQAEQADYAWGLTRFLDEARALARFDHPHLNKVHRFFEAHGTAYLVLEYIDGETLSAVLQRQGTLAEAQVTRLLGDVLSGLEEVHAAGYVHRDIKPSNLMLRTDGSAVLLDFGAARQAVGQRSKSVTSILTPGYAPIEQYDTKAEDVGPWSDIYALGMVAYRSISGLQDGELPDAVTRSRAVRKGSGELEPAASVGQGRYDARLLRAIDWAIQVEEDERPQSIGDWQQALPEGVSRGGPVPPPSGPPQGRPLRQGRSGPGLASVPSWAIITGVVALVVAVGGGAYRLGQQREPPPSGEAVTVPTTSWLKDLESEEYRSPPSGEAVTVPTTSPSESRQAVSPTAQESPPAEVPRQTASAGLEEPSVTAEPEGPSPAEVEAGLETYPTGRHVAEARRRQQEAAAQWQVGGTYRDALRAGGQGPALVVIPAGRFQMGCVSEHDCDDNERPVHRVTLPRPLAVGKYEVTFEEWDACVRGGGCNHRPDDKGWGRGQRPVIYVSWEDATAYVRWLSEETGGGYRLLSEAEWEYAARAGSGTAYSWGNELGRNRANCAGCGSPWDNRKTVPVGSFVANGYGLHDLHGNVWEWVQDCWHENYRGAPNDGQAWTSGGDCGRRVLRGGSWNFRPWSLRPAFRFWFPSVSRANAIGFRVARSVR